MKNITIMVTGRCNFRCKHCFVYAEDCGEVLPPKDMLFAIEKLQTMGFEKINFSGGEPMLCKDLFDYITFAKKKGLRVGLLTNASLLGRDTIIDLCGCIDSLSISLYTQEILGLDVDAFERYLSHMVDIFQQLSSLSFSFKITLPVSLENDVSAVALIERLDREAIRPNAVRLFIITPLGRGIVNRELCSESANCREYVGELLPLEIADRMNVQYEDSSVLAFERDIPRVCPVEACAQYGSNAMSIDPHMNLCGDIFPCGLLMGDHKYCAGNVYRIPPDQLDVAFARIGTVIAADKRLDCCPVLNRTVVEGKHLVCPIQYY